jgi:hypothetical protein
MSIYVCRSRDKLLHHSMRNPSQITILDRTARSIQVAIQVLFIVHDRNVVFLVQCVEGAFLCS